MRRVQRQFAPRGVALLAAVLALGACGETENGATVPRTAAEGEPESATAAESSDTGAEDNDAVASNDPSNATDLDGEASAENVGGTAAQTETPGAGGASSPAGSGGQAVGENTGGALNPAGAGGLGTEQGGTLNSAGAGGAGGSGPAPILAAPGELVIPIQPQPSIELGLLLTEDEAGNLMQAVETSLGLALGEEYPDVVQVQLNIQDFAGELAGVRITAMSVEGAGLGAQPMNEDTLELTIQEAGTFLLHISGEREPTPELSAAPWSVNVEVTVRRVAQVQLAGCVEPSGAVLSGETINLSWPQVFDENGGQFYPANAVATRPATVTVHATPDTTLSAPDGFRSLIAEGPEQIIRVTAATGDVGSFELITPARVTSLEAWFSMDAPWTRGLSLETGMIQNVLFTEPGTISIQPRLYVNGASLCNAVNRDWFTVDSLTPDVCPLVPLSDAALAADDLAMGAQVIAPGLCELEVSAPTLGDPSLSLTFSVEFQEQSVASAGTER